MFATKNCVTAVRVFEQGAHPKGVTATHACTQDANATQSYDGKIWRRNGATTIWPRQSRNAHRRDALVLAHLTHSFDI